MVTVSSSISVNFEQIDEKFFKIWTFYAAVCRNKINENEMKKLGCVEKPIITFTSCTQQNKATKRNVVSACADKIEHPKADS